MKHKLNAEQRSQALAWYAVMSFDLQTIADHFGITVHELSREISFERAQRKRAGKSPQPIPCKPPSGERPPTQADILLNAINALESILWLEANMKPQAALNEIKWKATSALRKAGKAI